MNDIRKIIVRAPNWIGDVIMSLPVLEDIKKKYPDVFLCVMIKKNLFELLKNNKNIDEIFFVDEKNSIKKIREKKFDIGILLTNSFSSAFLFYKAKIKHIIGYKKDFRSFLLDTKIYYPLGDFHQIIKYKMLLRPIDITISDTLPKFYLDDKEIKATKDILYARGFKDSMKLIGINPSARYGSAKCWGDNNYKEIISRLSFDSKNFIFLIGDHHSLNAASEIIKGMPKNVVNLANQTTIRELISLISLCNLFLTNDSGPMHIASALEVPLIAIFGSTSDSQTGPFSKNAIVINKHLSCSPCFKRKCKSLKCMKAIQVDDVLKEINNILK